MGVDHPKNFKNSDYGERERNDARSHRLRIRYRERGVQGDGLSER